MKPHNGIGRQSRMPAADGRTPITALKPIVLIAQALHQDHVILGNRALIEAGLAGRV